MLVQTQATTITVATAVGSASKAMATVGKQMDPAKMSATLAGFAKVCREQAGQGRKGAWAHTPAACRPSGLACLSLSVFPKQQALCVNTARAWWQRDRRWSAPLTA